MAPGPSAETVSAVQARLNGDLNSDGEIVHRKAMSKNNGVQQEEEEDQLSYADAVKKNNNNNEELGFDVELPSSQVMKLHPVCQDPDTTIYKPHLPRANLAVSKECPFGTQTNNWAKQHRNYSTMQQHCLFFDPDNDGVIWPSDTFRGLWQLGYPVVVIIWATVIIHAGFSWFSSDNWLLPDPFFRLTLKNVHRSKHGSDTHVFDQEGRFHPALFENIFTKYDRERKGGLTFMDGMRMLYGNRVVADFAGYLAGFVEWVLTYLLVAKDGVVYKDDLRKVYDGSIFFEIAGRKDGHY